MFPGVRSSLVFSGFGLKPPASGFQSYSYSSLKTSPSVTSKAVPSVVLASSVCMQSLQCLISALTQGGEDGHLFMLTCSVVLWEGRNLANIYHWRVWGVLAMYGPHWVCPTHGVYAFLVYTAQPPGCSAEELSKAGPGLHALPRSKPLRFIFSGTPQRHRLGWV